MDTLTIEGIPAYNGEYPLDSSYFTNRELNLIKTVSGVRAGELGEAFGAGDNDLMVALAAIAIWRAKGEKPNIDALWDAEAGKFTLNIAEPESEPEDESLPPSTAPDESDKHDDSSQEDGAISNGSSDLLESDLRAIGAQV
jgi:hypothetical protein